MILEFKWTIYEFAESIEMIKVSRIEFYFKEYYGFPH